MNSKVAILFGAAALSVGELVTACQGWGACLWFGAQPDTSMVAEQAPGFGPEGWWI